MDEERATAAYLSAIREISSALWKHDPDGMGSSISAPADEYDASASRLLVDLKDARSVEGVADYLRARFDSEHEELAVECWDALARFNARLTRGSADT